MSGTEKPACCSGGAKIIWILVAVMFVLHHDFWWWGDKTLVFGFIPIGLFYHAMYSLAAGVLWWGATRWAWPHHIEEWADEFENAAEKPR